LPGVSPTNTASTQTLAETSEVVGQGYSVNSQRNFSNSFVVDGLSDNDDGNRGTVVRGSYGLYYDRIQLRPLANALLSAHNTIDPNQAHC
jgi:hypothetical protein